MKKVGTLGDGNVGVGPWEPLWEPTLIYTTLALG